MAPAALARSNSCLTTGAIYPTGSAGAARLRPARCRGGASCSSVVAVGCEGHPSCIRLLSLRTDTMSTASRAVAGRRRSPPTRRTSIRSVVPHRCYAQNLMSYSVLADFKVTKVAPQGDLLLWGYEPEGAVSWEFSRWHPANLEATPDLKTDLARQPTAVSRQLRSEFAGRSSLTCTPRRPAKRREPKLTGKEALQLP